MTLYQQTTSLVFIGKFKPDDFHPQKLANGKAISGTMASRSELIALLPGQTVHFRIKELAELLVLQDRAQITSFGAPHIRIADLMIKAIREISIGTEVHQFGINVEYHYDLQTADNRNRLGVRLAPPEAWGPWGQSIKQSMEGDTKGTALQGGVMNLQMRQVLSDKPIGQWRDVFVGPSKVVPSGSGIMLKSNHHHQSGLFLVGDVVDHGEDQDQLLKGEDLTEALMKELEANFDPSCREAVSIFEGVLAGL